MAQDCFEFPPAHPESAAAFVNGEKWISPYTPVTAVPQGRYYMARRFQLRGGNYKLKIFVDDAATLWVGERFDSAAFVGSRVITDPIEDVSLYLPSGQQRLDFIVQNLPASPTPAGFIFSLWQDGQLIYATSAQGWRWDTKPIPDEDLPALGDPRRAMAVLTILPNWKDGVIERLSWLTDVLTSESGAEQRRALREFPRRSMEMNFLRKGPNRAALDAFLTGMGQSEFLLPLFHETITMTDGVDAGAGGVDFVQGLGSEREWTQDDLALVTNGDPGQYEVLKVGAVNENGFLWATPPERTWPPGTRIFPLRAARVMDSGQMENVTEDVATLAVRFELTDPMRVVDTWQAHIDGVPLFPFIPNRAQAVSGDYSRLTNVLDNEVGKITVTDISEHTAIQMGLAITLFGRHNVYLLRQFLAAARGRARTFLMPTFAADLEPINGDIPATTVLTVKASGLGRYHLKPQSARSMIAVTLAGEDIPLIARKVLGIERQFVSNAGFDVDYATDVWYDRLMLDSPLPALRADQFKRLSWISEARFAQDDFEIQHVTNISRAIRTSVSVRQLRERRFRNSNPPQVEFPPLDIAPTGPLILTDRTVQDISNALRCEASFALRDDGLVETRAESAGRTNNPGTWLADVREARLWDVRATQVGGNATPQLGELGAWQNLGGTRKWSVRSDNQGARDLVLQLQFREASSKTVRGSLQVTLTAQTGI